MESDNKKTNNNIETAQVDKNPTHEIFSATTKSGYVQPTYPNENKKESSDKK